MAALRLGAVDVVPKPSGVLSLRMDELGPRLVAVVRGAAAARIPRVRRLAERLRAARARQGPPDPAAAPRPELARPDPARPDPPHRCDAPKGPQAAPPGLVLVGASTGGPSALDALLGALPGDFPWPILVAQHMPATFTAALARRLDGIAALAVEEASAPVPLLPGHVYVGRGDADLVVARRPAGLVAMAMPADPRLRWHPSVERLVESALALLPPQRLLGVMMTGMGNDGAPAMTRLHALGGHTVAEAESTAVVWGMPGELVRAGGASLVAPLEAIAPHLVARLMP
jgi:two-component system chemotaxis response regulator CheB